MPTRNQQPGTISSITTIVYSCTRVCGTAVFEFTMYTANSRPIPYVTLSACQKDAPRSSVSSNHDQERTHWSHCIYGSPRWERSAIYNLPLSYCLGGRHLAWGSARVSSANCKRDPPVGVWGTPTRWPWRSLTFHKTLKSSYDALMVVDALAV